MKAIKNLEYIYKICSLGNRRCCSRTCFNGNLSFINPMNLASILENKSVEKRLAITPEIAKNIYKFGF